MLLDLKTTGWGPASRPTNRRTELVADWVEAQAYVSGSALAVSKHEVLDRLDGTFLVKNSDDGWTLVEDAFAACKLRRRQIGEAYPFAVAGNFIELVDDKRWAYLFCLLISLPEQLQVLRLAYPKEFRDLFESLVVEAMRATMPGWVVYPTGWETIADEGKGAIVEKVREWTLAKWRDESVFKNANDAQVDIAAVRPFGDARSAFPVILGQCATGVTDWKDKACRPNLDRWNKALQFTSTPGKLFAVPFSLDDDSFWEATVESSGLVLDRTRLCMALPTLPSELSGEIEAWLGRAKLVLPAAA